MSVFQCVKCGCAENTASGVCGHAFLSNSLDWTGLEAYEGKQLCIDCQPKRHKDGRTTKARRFVAKLYLPKGMFITNEEGNLVHKETGEPFVKYVLDSEDGNPIEYVPKVRSVFGD